MQSAEPEEVTRVAVAKVGGRDASPGLAWLALGVVVLSRLFIFAIGFLARSTLVVLHPHAMILAEPSVLYRGAAGRLLNGWANVDAGWYLSIAQHGYAHRYSEAFFPLYPLAVHAVAQSGLGYTLAGVTLSLICFVAAAMLLYRLTADALGPRTALWTVVFLSIAPTSFFFQAVYTESLFLLVSVALFFFAQRRRWLLAGLMGLLASLTRSTGVVLVFPLALLYLQSVGWHWRRVRLEALSVLLVPCGLAAYMAYLWQAHGDPMLYAHLEHRWHRYFAAPYVTVWQGAKYGYLGAAHILTDGRLLHPTILLWRSSVDTVNVGNFIALVVVAALIVLGWRRLGAACNAYAALALLFTLANPENTEPLVSLPRYMVVVFPLFMALGVCTKDRPRTRALLVGLCLVGLAWLTARFVLFAWVA